MERAIFHPYLRYNTDACMPGFPRIDVRHSYRMRMGTVGVSGQQFVDASWVEITSQPSR